MEILKAAMLYFSFVSAVGLLLGPMRNLWTNARVGPRSVTLIEAPIMLVVIALGAWLIVRRQDGPATTRQRLGVGLLALGLTMAIEVTGMIWVRGVTIAQYLASRDALAALVYVVLLSGLAVMPLLVAPARK